MVNAFLSSLVRWPGPVMLLHRRAFSCGLYSFQVYEMAGKHTSQSDHSEQEWLRFVGGPFHNEMRWVSCTAGYVTIPHEEDWTPPYQPPWAGAVPPHYVTVHTYYRSTWLSEWGTRWHEMTHESIVQVKEFADFKELAPTDEQERRYFRDVLARLTAVVCQYHRTARGTR